jgi:3-oxoacyl-[acyl-carrier protein] reductase
MELVMPSLQGKRAFVTGASRGIGAAIARRFAADGAAVAIGYERSADAAEAIAGEIASAGGRAVTIQMNAADPASIKQAVDRAASALGGLDILVNNAGIIRYGSVEAITLEDIDAMLAVNVRAVILATQAALPHMSEGGRIITTGSNLAERVPDAGKALYSASKSALVALTKGFARDLGPRGITVNLVHPGSTDTDMNPADGAHAEAQRERMAIKKYGRPENVAALYAFIASDEARSVNGTGFTVDGGANA